ncbi:MAG TPA: hypothetical protein VG937_06615 [Polyangiaceae bacterium]|jgi:hypothetical protein|nr:hypothetical protein [Polyangiaceae bacterium]
MARRVGYFLFALVLGAGCGGRTAGFTGDVVEGGSGGSASTGGTPTGGTMAITGGRPTGGSPTGGRATGGAPTGGMPTGGTPTGGTPTGGTPTGGTPTGGTPTGGTPTGGTPTGGTPTGGSPTGGTGNVGNQPNECSGYMNLWKIRQSVLAPLATEPTPGTDPACFECFMEAGCERPSGDCTPGNVCLDRHCFCTPTHTVPPSQCLVTDYPSNLCECVDSCFPAQKACAAQWRSYMKCVESVCTSECL